MRATVDWSYQLLEPDERIGVRPLGGRSPATSTLEAADAVVSDDAIDELEVLDALASLVAKSMLVAEDGSWRHDPLLDARDAPACSPATSSTSAMTLIDGVAVTPCISPTIAESFALGITGRG